MTDLSDMRPAQVRILERAHAHMRTALQSFLEEELYDFEPETDDIERHLKEALLWMGQLMAGVEEWAPDREGRAAATAH